MLLLHAFVLCFLLCFKPGISLAYCSQCSAPSEAEAEAEHSKTRVEEQTLKELCYGVMFV